jgi:hypothetical protein
LEVHLPHHIGRINTPPEPGIKPERHHSAETFFVPGQQLPAARVVAASLSRRFVSLESPG